MMTKSKGISVQALAFLMMTAASAGFAQGTRAPQTPPSKSPVVTSPTNPNTRVIRPGNASAKAPLLQGKVPIGRVLNAKPPIPFTPFPMLDIKTNQPVAATATITLPNGRKVLAGKYYETMNKTEQQLNSIGMTMRGKKDVLVEIMPTTPPSLIKTQLTQIKSVQPSQTFKASQFAVRKKALEQETRAKAMYEKMRLDAINAKVKDKADSISHPKTEASKGGGLFGGPTPAPALQVFQQPVAQFSGPNKPEDIVLGDPAYASLNLSTKLLKNMSPLQAYFGVQGTLGLTLLSQKIDPAVVSAGFRAPLVGEKGLTITLKAPYAPAPLPYNKPSAGLELNGEQSVPLTGEVKTTVVLGIIPVTFAAGIRGKAGILYGVKFIATGSTPDNQPIDTTWYTGASQKSVDGSTFAVGLGGHADVFVNATVYASAVAGGSVDLGLCTVGASLGVETDLVLLDGRIVFEVDALMEKKANSKADGKLTYAGTYQLKQAMAGELFIEAKLDFCIKTVTYRYYFLRDAGVPPESRVLFQGPEGDIN